MEEKMRTLERTIRITVLDCLELTTTERLLLQHACHVRLNAQAPYSNYWVGASLITTDGIFSDGCNVENVNWSETGHAEENAINSAVARLGPCRIAAMAIVGAPAGQIVSWPPSSSSAVIVSPISSVGDVCPSCGRCLQKIAENCFNENGKFDPNVVLFGYRSGTGEIYRTTIGDAYPMPFLPRDLGINYSKDLRLKKIRK